MLKNDDGAAYSVSVVNMLPYRYIRFRSGTAASPVNQGADRVFTAMARLGAQITYPPEAP